MYERLTITHLRRDQGIAAETVDAYADAVKAIDALTFEAKAGTVRASVLLHERTALVETLDEHRRELEAITAELKIRGV